jgi:hypothetical protein
MATFQKFNQFVGDLGLGKHNLNSDVFKVMLTNVAPAAGNSVKADITEITPASGYAAGGTAIPSTAYSQTSGTGNFTGSDVVFTAGAAIGPFRYAVIYNDTQTSPADPLVGFADYGSSISLAIGETFTVDFGAQIFTIGP